MEFKKTTLSNGLRIITTSMPQMRSVATTVFVGAGSRYEAPKINGISHFLEHMVFKGTKDYPNPAAVAQSIEGIGGQMNAWTDQDHTNYYNIVPKEHADIGLKVVSQLVLHPLMKESDIEREKGVIIEEINRRFDDPSSYVIELAIAELWPDQPMGWPVIGERQNIIDMKLSDFRQYMGQHYTARSIVISAAGDIDHDVFVSQVQSLFEPVANKPAVVPIEAKEEQADMRINIFHKKTDQAHLALGVRAFSWGDPDRYAGVVMNALLGQGMSSRLFMRIREEQGLAYYIRSMLESYQDTGALFIHAGLNIDKLDAALEAVTKEFKNLRDAAVDKNELSRTKELLKGALSLSMDDTETVATWFGRQELLAPETLTHDEVIERIEKITPEDIIRVARRIFQNRNLNLAVIGPLKDDDKYRRLLNLG